MGWRPYTCVKLSTAVHLGRVLLGLFRNRITRNRRYSCSLQSYSVHCCLVSRMNGIRFTRNTQNTRSFGKCLAGNAMRPPAVAWLPVGRRSSSQVTSAMSIPFSELISVLLEIEILCIALFLNRNRNSQNSPIRMHP